MDKQREHELDKREQNVDAIVACFKTLCWAATALTSVWIIASR